MNLRWALVAALVAFVLMIGPPILLLAADAVGFAVFLTWGLVLSSMVLSFGFAAFRR